MINTNQKPKVMKPVIYLVMNKRYRKYNETVRRKLSNAGIQYVEVSIRGSRKLMVNNEDFDMASRIVLSVSHSN